MNFGSSITLVLNFICNRLDDIVVYALAIIIGIVLIKRTQNDNKGKIAAGMIIIALGLVLERALPFVINFISGVPVYVVIMSLIFIIRAAAILAAFFQFSRYRASNWVYGLIAILFVVNIFKSIYYGNVIYQFGSIALNSNTGFMVLLSFMNNNAALTTVTLLCKFVPAAAIFTDALSTTTKR